jgi:hypothetical protein
VATKNVNIDIIAKDKTRQAMQSATKGVNDLKDNVKRSVSAQTNSFNALGNTVRNVIGGVIVFQAFRFGQEMVKMASSVEEMRSKSSVVFGQFVNDVRSQLGQFGDSVGRSTHELEQMASSIQDTFVPMGFARGEASKLSVELTKLAVDVASFNNASDTETMMAFQSALVGNHETVRRFGVVITEATLKQELLRMGINKSAKDVTNAEKVQARLNLIIAGTSDAHDDATRTSGSFANTSKALGSALSELSVDIMTPMLPKLTRMAEGFIDATDTAREFFTFIGMLNRDLSTNALRQDRIAEIELQLSEIRGGLLTKFIGLNKVEKIHIQNLEAELGHLKNMPELMAMVSDAEIIQTKTIENQNKAIAEKNKLLEKEIKLKNLGLKAFPTAKPDIIGFQKPTGAELMGGGLDASMTGSEMLGGASPQIVALQDMADIEVAIAQQTADKKLSILQSFNKGFMDSLESQKSAFTQIEDIGRQSFGKLKTTLTDFVMTGKLNFADLGKFVIRSFVEMLVGEAVKMAFGKSMAMFKADAIKKAMISLYEGAMKTFAQIPFPLNILAVAGALAFGNSLINKIKGFEKGGRPPVGQASIVGEKGAELFVPDQAGTIVPNDKLGMGKQVTVNFNINTVDARGFNELLVNSRGTIVNMINSAMNEKGNVAII